MLDAFVLKKCTQNRGMLGGDASTGFFGFENAQPKCWAEEWDWLNYWPDWAVILYVDSGGDLKWATEAIFEFCTGGWDKSTPRGRPKQS